MKKILVMSALVAISAAFVACSNENDLVQQAPVVPEETVVGTPFTISTGADTRATLYNANAWDKSNSTTWVSDLKLYGKQGSNDPWMNSVVFHREAYDGDWAPNRSATEASLASVNWPTADKTTPTSFYAITDNAIGAGTTAAIAGVSEWMSTPGSFTYTQPTATGYTWDTENDPYVFDVVSKSYVNAGNLTDVMVATTSKSEDDVTNGTLPLEFKHLLSGLSIKVKFKSDDALSAGAAAEINAVMVRGLYTAGTYTFGSGWSGQSGDDICYYKSFATPISLVAEAESSTSEPTPLVGAGEWLVIPQQTTPWDETADTEHFPGAKAGRQMAYIALYIRDVSPGTDDTVPVYFPLDATFNAAKNKTITLELSLGRDIWLDSDFDGKADYQFEPSQTDGN